MSKIVVDARGWQNTMDLETGEKIEAESPVVLMTRSLLQKHPYPGDMDMTSNKWVTDTALDLMDCYQPRFAFLIYAAQYFTGRYTPMTKEARAEMIACAFSEVERFVSASGFSAIVVGTGDMTSFTGFIDCTRLDGLAVCTHWSTRYAGLYTSSPADMKQLGNNPYIEKIVSRREIVSLFNATAEQALRIPEYLMLARKGYAFKTISDVKKTPVMIPSLNFHVPLYAPGYAVEAVTGIRKVLEEELSQKHAALIVLEGVGSEEFLWPHKSCRNGTAWQFYEPGDAQYLTVSSGEHRFLDYPTGYKFFGDESDGTTKYPFSGYFKSIPKGVFADAYPGKSIAVGNKSMFVHMVTGADICVECFSRNLYNQGTMAVIHREDKM